MKLLPLLPVWIAVVACAGCYIAPTYELFDDWWLRTPVGDGEDPAVARECIAGRNHMRRVIGCRSLGIIAEKRRRDGDDTGASRIARELEMHFLGEGQERVRQAIAGICLRDAGRGDWRTTAFLTERLREGPPGPVAAVAWTLASRDMGGRYEDVASAYGTARAMGDAELCHELLGAMWLLGDPRALGLMCRALDEMRRAERGDPACEALWPAKMHKVLRSWYLSALDSRIDRLSAWTGVARPDEAVTRRE